MEWICGVTYTHSGFCLRTIDGNQAEHVRPVKELQSVLASEGKHTKIRGNTSFADWRELSTEETDDLATELGFPTGCNGQSFYKFEVEDYRYIIPAGVLMCAMFRPFHGIARYLFAPQGLDNLCMPYGNCEKPELMFFVYLRRTTGIQEEKAEGILNTLSWMHCYPSARKMWNSVPEHARLGLLDVTLPTGTTQFVGNGQLLQDRTVLISEFRIQLLKTQEMPFKSFSMHTQTIEFERILHKLENPKQYPRQPKDNSISLRDGDWLLTDEEWSVLENIVVRPGRGAKNARRLLNLVLQKLSQSLSWSEVSQEKWDKSIASQFLSRIKADGRWEQIISKLAEMRA